MKRLGDRFFFASPRAACTNRPRNMIAISKGGTRMRVGVVRMDRRWRWNREGVSAKSRRKMIVGYK